MKKKTKKVIEEFIEATPIWLKEMEAQKKYGGFPLCPFCGMNPKNITELLEAIKDLYETSGHIKAFQVDMRRIRAKGDL